MQIGVTNPLREFLKWKPYAPWAEEIDPFFCWDAHRVVVDGRVMLVVCNAANRFTGVTAMRSGDWKRMHDVCEDLIGQAMLSAGFSETAVREYLELAGEIEFGRTHGRKAVAHLNRMVKTLSWCECDRENQLQHFLMHVVNDEDLCHCATRDDYGVPTGWMAEDLKAHGITPRPPKRNIIDFESIRRTDPEDDRPSASPNLQDVINSVASYQDPYDGIETVAKSEHLFPPEYDKRMNELDMRIAAIERSMLADRGFEVPHRKGCRVCGAPPRVKLDNDDYCLSCYNELVERMMGIPPVTNDQSTLAVFGKNGEVIQFGVERFVTPLGAEWVAHETLADDDPRKSRGYEGITVSTYADPTGDQDEALAELWEKAQQAVDHPSTRCEEGFDGIFISNGVHIGDEVRFAEESGWGRIDMIDDEYCIVIDGQRYSGDEFLRLMSSYPSFNLCWTITDRTDPLPESADVDDG